MPESGSPTDPDARSVGTGIATTELNQRNGAWQDLAVPPVRDISARSL